MSPRFAEPVALDQVVRPRRSWRDPRTRAILWQAVVVAAACAVVAMVAMQTAANLRARDIASGFDYLSRAAGFEIAQGGLSYSSRDTYARALEVGLVNTLRVAGIGIAVASALGLLVGVARLSPIWIVSVASRVYVEVLRNTPLLLQLLFWYSLSQALPRTDDALNPLPGVFLTDRGLFLPRLVWQGGWLQFGRIALERPAFSGFGFRGGLSISPEFAALLVGLSTYTSAFIGEIVRGGILAVDGGQTEAAAALGLSRLRTLRLVVLPQALPVVVPPTTSQFLNLAKNSSLAVAIGYPDVISITNTTLNQTGQAVEAIAICDDLLPGDQPGHLVPDEPVGRRRRANRRPGARRMLTRVARAVRRAPMFRDRTNAVATAALGAVLVYLAWRFGRWAVANAVWTLPEGADSALCRAAAGRGACWAVVHERFRYILLGAYPLGEQWRPALACGLFVSLYAASAVRAWWKPWLAGVWIAVPAAAVILLRGGVAGLTSVPSEFWGGLPLTFLLSTLGFAAAFPSRSWWPWDDDRDARHPHPGRRYIELVRGVPLIRCCSWRR